MYSHTSGGSSGSLPAELRVAYRDIEAAGRGALQSLRAARQAEASARAELPGLRSLVQPLQTQAQRAAA